MNLCSKCWKNMKDQKGIILKSKKSHYAYKLCEECIKSDLVQDLINNFEWEILENESINV